MTIKEMQRIEEFVPSGLIRCDACGPSSQAYVRFVDDSGVFNMCGHHATKHELALVSLGYFMQDRRDVLERDTHAYKTVSPDDDNF